MISIIGLYIGNRFVAPVKIYITLDYYGPDGIISKAEYFIGSTKIGETLKAPYSFSFESLF
jgi:hypothetical protein